MRRLLNILENSLDLMSLKINNVVTFTNYFDIGQKYQSKITLTLAKKGNYVLQLQNGNGSIKLQSMEKLGYRRLPCR